MESNEIIMLVLTLASALLVPLGMIFYPKGS